MTERLYWLDPYLQRFTATVIAFTEHNGQPAVILDRTAFYPTGGGQPHDRGALNGIPVVEVIEQDTDGAILHILARPLETREVEGHIDWERRFDHMQQHTGQHILSQAFLRITGAQTVSFHMGEEMITIDLDQIGFPPAVIEAVEGLANQVVLEDREVRTRFVEAEEVEGLGLRRPPKVEGRIRIVEVADFDRSACGGTHVRRTGEVGPIKIVKLERRGNETRVSFLCGWRALRDYWRKHRLLLESAGALSVGEAMLPEAIRALQAELKEARKALTALQELYLDLALPDLEQKVQPASFGEILVHLWPQLPSGLLPRLARRLSEGRPRLVVLASGGADGLLIVARGPGVPLDAREVLQRILQQLGREGGGGRPDYAQAPVPRVDLQALRRALGAAMG
ncbi:MAG: DHHA1 domain-containing protein [Anaerolineae bacterium]|uniref:alanyl-tRNA editing protein n=1 Tax=Thermoflexus sp. TaxID=1969742 RepID=UPI0025DAC659|nr:DHHA1 domain-containing protein [Thermoflexus sp.]MCS7350190.1 DHHA1 domain-containing protein [Thermoflexus sp.]MDW8179639.1 DHHA1 domain-containing protein [Anaerolineae bacterium]